MLIQYLDSKVVPLSKDNRMFTSNRDAIIDDYFFCVDEPESNQARVRPRSNSMSTSRTDEGFKQLHKCKSQAKGLVDLLSLPVSSSSGSGSPKSATQFPRRDGGDGHHTKTGKHRTTRSSFPFPSLPSCFSTKSIPIASSSLKRTASELQLLEDEAMADYRDFCMFTRILNGMNQRSSWTQLPSFNGEMQNIIRTRHNPVEEGPSSYMREGLERHSVNSPLPPPKVVRTIAAASTLSAAPSLPEVMTPCYNHTTRKARRSPAIVIQEPTDFVDDNFVMLGGMAYEERKCLLPSFPHPNVDSHEQGVDESEGVFVMDDV